MNERVEVFLRWFCISAALFAVYATLLVFKIRRRESWLRYTAAESTFWRRLGVPGTMARSIRRFGESRLSTFCLGFITLLFALLTVLNAGAYLHFKGRVKVHAAVPSPISRQHY